MVSVDVKHHVKRRFRIAYDKSAVNLLIKAVNIFGGLEAIRPQGIVDIR